MSHESNTIIFERVARAIDYWGDTTISKVLELDLERNDLESLRAHLKEAEDLMYERELAFAENTEPMTDERLDDIMTSSNEHPY